MFSKINNNFCRRYQSQYTNSKTQNVRRIVFGTAVVGITGCLIYDGTNEFEYVGAISRFCRSLKIASVVSFDYFWSLYGIEENTKEYNEV